MKDGIYLGARITRRNICLLSNSRRQEVVKIDLNQPMKEILATLQDTRLDAGADDRHHDRRDSMPLRERLEKGSRRRITQEPSGLLRRPGRRPMASGVRTDHGRADGFLCRPVPGRGRIDADGGQGHRARCVRLARRSRSIGGAAANLAEHCIKKVDNPITRARHGSDLADRGWISGLNIIDDKGNDFFKELNLG
jgi:fumarate hydratase class I